MIELTREHGLDVSTMALYEALRTAPANADFVSRIDAEPIVTASGPAGAKILVIPALFYRHYPEVGGDAALSIGIPLQHIWAIVWGVAGFVALVAGMLWGARNGVQDCYRTL